MKYQPIQDRALNFAVEIYNYCKKLQNDEKEYIISKQLIRSSSSIGANSFEAIHAESKADFIHKLSISTKETSETIYWLKFLYKIELLKKDDYKRFSNEAIQIKKIITTIILNTKQNKN